MLIDEIHDQICAALEKAGGTNCDALIADPNAVRADVYFPDAGVVVEVKSLTSDRNKTQSVRQRAGLILHESAAKEGGPVFFGDVTVPLSSLPRNTAEKLLMNLGQRVAKEIRSANKQIKATAQVLDKRAVGLIVFGVPAHFDTHVGVIMAAAARVLKPHKHQAIHGIMVIGVPVSGYAPKHPPTLSFHPRSFSKIPSALSRVIFREWIAHLQAVDGERVFVLAQSEQDFMSKFMADEAE